MKDLLTSKKFQAAVIAVLAQIAAKFGLELDEASALMLISPIIAYIVGQGVADLGKSAAKETRPVDQPKSDVNVSV